MGVEQEIHRPGPLKQTNKAHKTGRHRSKGSIAIASKGKTSIKVSSKKARHELSKEQRRHQAVQLRKNRREEFMNKRRAIGGLDSSPFLVCLVPLHEKFDPQTALTILKQCDCDAVINQSVSGATHLFVPRFKQRFEFLVPNTKDPFVCLDTLKVADTVLFVASATAGFEFGGDVIDSWGETMLVSALAQGLPTPMLVLTDLESIAPKKRHEHKQLIQKLFSKWFPTEKLCTLDKDSDGINILRRIGNQKRKSVFYRDRRPHMFAEDAVFVPDEQGDLGTLKLSGYLRGTSLSVNNLVHIPGLGDFQMDQIDAVDDPFAVDKNRNKEPNCVTESAQIARILEKCDPAKQESLDAENVPDLMDAEQTWPTAEELAMAKKEQKQKKFRGPEGWSTYQAAWIPEEDAETVGSDAEESEIDDSNYMEPMSEEHSEYSGAEDFDTTTESEIGVNDEKYDQDLDVEDEKQTLEKLKAAKGDQMFPDEIDTPLDQPARVRFQKYRGLESFRTSPWDPNENLPSDYARIYNVKNFDRFKRKIIKEQEEIGGALAGWYVTLHIKNVSQVSWSALQASGHPLIVMGLFSSEHKMSVQNVVLKRTSNFNLPIKSKEKLVFQCGYRRFSACPIFSQHTNGQKHKFERFFQPDSLAVATFYAPIQFPPAPVLCYKEIGSQLILVATGSLLSCNPDRMILKRIVLSGHAFKIHKRSAVIRFMFFNREDIMFYKQCKLRTKMGRSGHIKEPLGTHGHMKCIFDNQLKSQDTILLNLYKRVFPKWTYEEYLNLAENCDKHMEINC